MRLVTVENLSKKKYISFRTEIKYRPRQHEFVETGIPFVRFINGQIRLTECDQINETAFRRVRKGIGKGGDIVLTRSAGEGSVAHQHLLQTLKQQFGDSTAPKVLNQKYLYYFMRSDGPTFLAHTGRNATFDYVSLTKQRSLVKHSHPLPDQETHRPRSRTLDNKIELNRKRMPHWRQCRGRSSSRGSWTSTR